jgi:hypothetical protein
MTSETLSPVCGFEYSDPPIRQMKSMPRANKATYRQSGYYRRVNFEGFLLALSPGL